MSISPTGGLSALSTSGTAALAAPINASQISTTTIQTSSGAASTTGNPAPRFSTTSLTPYGLSYNPDAIVNAPQATAGSTLQFPGDIGQYWMKIEIAKYSRISWDTVGVTQTLATIILPLSEQLVDSSTVDYQTVPLGMTGAAAMWAFGKSADAATAAKHAADGLTTVEGALTSAGISGVNDVFQLIGGNIAGNPAGAIEAARGIALNEYMTILLKGPSYKIREFSWKFSPRNAQESQNLSRILTCLKNAQAPTRALDGLFWAWPMIFRISFWSAFGTTGLGLSGPVDGADGSTSGGWLFGFKPMVMNDMIVNYSPVAPSFHRADSSPESIQLLTRFTELEFWLGGDYTDFSGQKIDLPPPEIPAIPNPLPNPFFQYNIIFERNVSWIRKMKSRNRRLFRYKPRP
jgi:hypothetical protein